jgi:hypothetical protein
MPPQKAAKKAPADHKGKYHHTKDLRRAYENLGRVEVLQQMPNGSSSEVLTLVNAGHEAVLHGTSKNAADLLRAAEHLAFAGILDRDTNNTHISESLISAIQREFERLEEKAEDHFDLHGDSGPIASVYRNSLKKAIAARDAGAYRQALELMRAAEALAHVKPSHKLHKHGLKKVAARSNVRELAAS